MGNLEVRWFLSVRIRKINQSTVRITGEPAELMDIQDHFTFDLANAKYRSSDRKWDGKVRVFLAAKESIGAGLVPRIAKFLGSLEHEVSIDKNVLEMFQQPEYNEDKLNKFLDSLDLRDEHGNELELRLHQIEPIHAVAKSGRMTILSPTSSGKSLIIYCLCRWILHNFPKSRILLIVPTIMLVEQMKIDFITYASHDSDFNAESKIHGIYAGKEKDLNTNIVISTWQSLVNLDASWFESFETLIIDECHGAKGNSIQNICYKLTNASRRIGFTGTIGNESETDPLLIECALGPIRKFVTTKQLMDKGIVALLKIRCLILRHSQEDTRELPGETFDEERVFIISSEKRNRWLSGLIRALPGNTLVLFTNKEHGRLLYEAGLKVLGDRRVFLRTGDNSIQSRLEIKPYIENELGVVVYASTGILSTGVSWRNVDHIVFASSFKKKIKVLQSIGRGLRLSKRKTKVGLWDISDDLNHHQKKLKRNYSMKHLLDRLSIYESEQFDYKMEKHDL
jgi:superfamily II DNA or RNA helicase